MFAIPPADRDQFRRWTLIIGGADERSVSEQPRAYAQTMEYLTRLIHSRRGGAGSDLLTGLIAVREGSDQLDDTELLGTAAVLPLAGFATTGNLIANAWL